MLIEGSSRGDELWLGGHLGLVQVGHRDVERTDGYFSSGKKLVVQERTVF